MSAVYPPLDPDEEEQLELRAIRRLAEVRITAEPEPTQAEPRENRMSDKPKCPGCNKTLRYDNTRGACSKCIASGEATAVKAPPGAPREKAAPSVRKQFKSVTAALDIDGDELLEGFCRDWLEKIRGAAKRANDDT